MIDFDKLARLSFDKQQSLISKIKQDGRRKTYDDLLTLYYFEENPVTRSVYREIIDRKEVSLEESFLDSLSEHERDYLLANKANDPVGQIPRGVYCYSILSVSDDGFTQVTKSCPHWSIDESQDDQNNGCCALLDTRDSDGTSGGLLWDGVKDCGLRDLDYDG